MQLIGHRQKQDQTSRENIQVTFQIFEKKDVKSHKMNKNMVSDIFSNLNTTMCHVFIQDQKFMLAPIILFESSFDD